MPWRQALDRSERICLLGLVRRMLPEQPQDSRLDVELAMAKLPRRQRQATVLRYYLGYDVADTARVLGVSEGTIKTTLHRARHTMAAALGEEE